MSSWSTKDRLTTQVIYDEIEDQYVAVFNENHIRVWSEDSSDLDKVKKHKFHCSFYTILKIDRYPPILVRPNGSTASLSWALNNRKLWQDNGILNKDEKIENSQLITVHSKLYLCMLTRSNNGHNYVIVLLNEPNYIQNITNVTKIGLQRASETLVGHVVIQDKNNAYLLTLCKWKKRIFFTRSIRYLEKFKEFFLIAFTGSHGRLYSYPLIGYSTEKPPGKFLSVITTLSTKHPVIMTPLNEMTIAAYGADTQEEGAVLIIYNLLFKLAQATQKLKLYTKEAKLWKVEDKLLLAANRHLAIAPYSLTPQRIETMIGSSRHTPAASDAVNGDEDIVVLQEMKIVSWEESKKKITKFTDSVPHQIKKQLSLLAKEGLPETVILETLVPPMMSSKDIASMIWCLKNFADVPEKLLVDLLSFCLTTSDETFDSIQNGFTDLSEIIRPPGRAIFLNHILGVSYTDISLLSHLKSGLAFNETLLLLHFITQALDATQDEHLPHKNEVSQPGEDKLLEWASLLLDSHYQQYLLSQDPKVCLLLEQLSSVLETHVNIFDNY